MTAAKSLGFFILILCVSLFSAHLIDVRDTHHWDLLIFTQNWPPTVCKEWKDRNPSHTCVFPQKKTFTIHGIWPTKLGTIGPAFCNKTWLFDPEEIRPIESDLRTYWTNIEAETSTYNLWAHEWNKHGTCAAILEPLNGQLKYFSKGIEFWQKFEMSNILTEADIIPSNDKEYHIDDIQNAIKVRLGVNPAIECRKEHGKSWLVEIRICFNKTLGLSDCDGIVRYHSIRRSGEVLPVLTNCDPSLGIIYPVDVTSPPNRLFVQLYKAISWLQWFTL